MIDKTMNAITYITISRNSTNEHVPHWLLIVEVYECRVKDDVEQTIGIMRISCNFHVLKRWLQRWSVL